MRKFHKSPALMLTAATLSLVTTACGAPEQPEAETGEEYEGVAEGSDLTPEEIEEAVPGVEAVDPEGNTPSTADLGDEDNIEVSEIDDPEDPDGPPQ